MAQHEGQVPPSGSYRSWHEGQVPPSGSYRSWHEGQVPPSGSYRSWVETADEQAVLAEIVSRILRVVRPERIVLFGSRARGEAGPESDYDILVVAPSTELPWRRTVSLYRALAGLGVPKEIVWWTPPEIAEWGGVRSHFVNCALRDGKVLYERPA